MKGRIKWLIAGVFFSALCGCSPRVVTQEVPVMIHDSVRVVQTERVTDTIRETNTISLIDTMWLDTSTVATLGMPVLHHARTTSVASDRNERSTNTSADTICVYRDKPVPYKVEVPVVRPLTWWQRVLMWLGGVLGIGIVTMVAWAMWRVRH